MPDVLVITFGPAREDRVPLVCLPRKPSGEKPTHMPLSSPRLSSRVRVACQLASLKRRCEVQGMIAIVNQAGPVVAGQVPRHVRVGPVDPVLRVGVPDRRAAVVPEAKPLPVRGPVDYGQIGLGDAKRFCCRARASPSAAGGRTCRFSPFERVDQEIVQEQLRAECRSPGDGLGLLALLCCRRPAGGGTSTSPEMVPHTAEEVASSHHGSTQFWFFGYCFGESDLMRASTSAAVSIELTGEVGEERLEFGRSKLGEGYQAPTGLRATFRTSTRSYGRVWSRYSWNSSGLRSNSATSW